MQRDPAALPFDALTATERVERFSASKGFDDYKPNELPWLSEPTPEPPVVRGVVDTAKNPVAEIGLGQRAQAGETARETARSCSSPVVRTCQHGRFCNAHRGGGGRYGHGQCPKALEDT
jgi:hypothetical protein